MITKRTRVFTRRQWRMITDYVMYHEQAKQLQKNGVKAEVKMYSAPFGGIRISLEVEDEVLTA